MQYSNFFDPNEKPLEQLLPDGGFCGIFRTIGCVGDSLSSGEFQTKRSENAFRYTDMFEYSWGQFMARTIGSNVYNFSKGGMTARQYMESFAEEKGFWDPQLACQAYIIALGVNDIGKGHPMGSIEDITPDWRQNGDTFVGNYGAIIQRLKEIQPGAKFFLMTHPRWANNRESTEQYQQLTELIYAIAGHFENCYVMDLFQYAPPFDQVFQDNFLLHRHGTPTGYLLAAKMIMSYMDYIIRHNMEDFKMVGFIGREHLLDQDVVYQVVTE